VQERKSFLIPAIVISAVLHLLYLSLFGLKPGKTFLTDRKYSEIIFLGSILEKSMFNLSVVEKPVRPETMYKSPAVIRNEKWLDIDGPERQVGVSNLFDKLDSANSFSGKKYDSGKNPLSVVSGSRAIYYNIEEKTANKFIEGPVKSRDLIFKPETPYLPRNRYANDENYVIKFKFNISESGNVVQIEPVLSSGNAEVDILYSSYLRKWKFAPVSYAVKKEKDWGVVTLHVKGE